MSLACEDIGPLRELAVHRPRRPQDSALHRALREHLETYLTLRRADPEREPLPDHVERTFRGRHTAGPCCWRASSACASLRRDEARCCRWCARAAELG